MSIHGNMSLVMKCLVTHSPTLVNIQHLPEIYMENNHLTDLTYLYVLENFSNNI